MEFNNRCLSHPLSKLAWKLFELKVHSNLPGANELNHDDSGCYSLTIIYTICHWATNNASQHNRKSMAAAIFHLFRYPPCLSVMILVIKLPLSQSLLLTLHDLVCFKAICRCGAAKTVWQSAPSTTLPPSSECCHADCGPLVHPGNLLLSWSQALSQYGHQWQQFLFWSPNGTTYTWYIGQHRLS